MRVNTGVQRNEQAIAAWVATLDWRAYATNAPDIHLSFEEAIIEYHNEYLMKHGFGRLKGKQLQISPMFVKRDDQVLGWLVSGHETSTLCGAEVSHFGDR